MLEFESTQICANAFKNCPPLYRIYIQTAVVFLCSRTKHAESLTEDILAPGHISVNSNLSALSCRVISVAVMLKVVCRDADD